MSVTAISSAAKPLPSPALKRFSWGVLGYFIAVILWGAVTRATGAGNGCGNHWPLCNGTVMQPSASINTIIEFTHRITSGISLFALVALLVWTFRATTRGHMARPAAIASLVFVVIEAILGAFLVKLGLTAQSQSPLRAPYLALHFTNTLLLMAALTFTAHMLGRTRGFMRNQIKLVAPGGAIAGILMVLVVGVTGSLAALGDTLFPASSLGTAFTQDFEAKSSWLVRWRWTHPAVAVLACLFLIWILVRAARGSSLGHAQWDNRKLSALVFVLLIAQYILGVMDVTLLAPVWLQIVHLLGADVLWAALIVLTARLTLQPAEQRS